MHLGIPFSVWRSPDQGHCDFIIYHEQGWPYIIKGDGKMEFSIPCPKNAVQKPVNFPGFYPDRYGFGYRTRVADIDGDGIEEIIVYDRKRAWIFRPVLFSRIC